MAIRSFLRIDERGAITPLMLVLFIGLLLTTGIALDLARYESERADLQNSLDRGVLAAASLSQTLDAETTVNEYLDTRMLSRDVLEVRVISQDSVDARRVDASAIYDMDTSFLRMVGMSGMSVPAISAAAQRTEHLEVSLVVDISGSMAREFTGGTGFKRLDVLRTSAANFVDAVLTPSAVPTTTMSLVPYSGQVNAGVMFDHFNDSRVHTYSSCTEFTQEDFDTTELPAANSRAQVPHFQWFTFEGGRGHEADWGWCPSDDQAIVPLSNDPDALKAQINGLIGHDGTGTPNGMKWGLGLLDPTTQGLTQDLVTAGVVNSEFSDRPVAFNTPDTLKVLVVMTDGNIRYQQRPKPQYYNSNYEIDYWANNRLSSSYATLDSSSERNADEALQSDRFLALCARAKQRGVVVFTIGFDIDAGDDAYNEMRSCASSPSHFYDVDGLDLDAAFQQIATNITKLKLVL